MATALLLLYSVAYAAYSPAAGSDESLSASGDVPTEESRKEPKPYYQASLTTVWPRGLQVFWGNGRVALLVSMILPPAIWWTRPRPKTTFCFIWRKFLLSRVLNLLSACPMAQLRSVRIAMQPRRMLRHCILHSGRCISLLESLRPRYWVPWWRPL